MTSHAQDLSTQLRALRRRAKLSLSALARRAGTSAATLSRYERGWDRFELYTLRKLADAMGCRLEVRFVSAEAPAPAVTGRQAARSLRRLFWDVPLRERHLDEYPAWAAARVLEYGSLDDVRTLAALWGRSRFLQTVAETRFSSVRTEQFWKSVLEREGLRCTRKRSPRAVAGSWNG